MAQMMHWSTTAQEKSATTMEPPSGAPQSQDQTTKQRLAEMTTPRDEAVTHGTGRGSAARSSHDPMVVYDLQSQIVRANPAFHALLTRFSTEPYAATLEERADALTLRDFVE